jgi:hypothetical protein
MPTTKQTAAEVGTILDSLAALSQDLSCHGKGKGDELVLSASKTLEACEAIDSAVDALKKILALTVAAGGGPVPPTVAKRLDDASDK